MNDESDASNRSEWRTFLRKHGNIAVLFVVAGIMVIIGAVLVYLWFVGDAQSTGLVPSVLGLWTMGHLVTFILNLIFWELILIGIPVLVMAVAGWQWWKRLPAEERMGYRLLRKGSRASRGGGGGSGLLFIVFAIKVYIDGEWNVAMSTWTLDYVVNSFIAILIWVAIICGVPAAIGLVWWIRHNK